VQYSYKTWQTLGGRGGIHRDLKVIVVTFGRGIRTARVMRNHPLEIRHRHSLETLPRSDRRRGASFLRDNARRAKICMLALVSLGFPGSDGVLAPWSSHAVDWLICAKLGNLVGIIVECLWLQRGGKEGSEYQRAVAG
jgi:hypothetical protein